jgi:hypothetical protein
MASANDYLALILIVHENVIYVFVIYGMSMDITTKYTLASYNYSGTA